MNNHLSTLNIHIPLLMQMGFEPIKPVGREDYAIFQLISPNFNILIKKVYDIDEWEIRDGRASMDKVFYEGSIKTPKDLIIRLMQASAIQSAWDTGSRG